jgi:hypothetical protein
VEEVARAVDFEKALAKSEALCAEKVITISEKDQAIVKLQVEQAGNQSSWKKAATQGEVSAMTSSKKVPLADQSSELKKWDDQIVKLWVQLRFERRALRRLHTQLHWVVIVRNRAWYCGYVWGFETFRSLMLYGEQRGDFKRVNINDLLIDEDAMGELAMIGIAELPDVPNLSNTQLTTALLSSEPDSTDNGDEP